MSRQGWSKDTWDIDVLHSGSLEGNKTLQLGGLWLGGQAFQIQRVALTMTSMVRHRMEPRKACSKISSEVTLSGSINEANKL